MKYKVILFSLLMAHSGNAYLYGSTSKDIKTYITNRDSLHVNSSTVAKSIIKGEVINDISIPSVGNALQGLLPGLMVQQNSGEPGNDFSLSNVYVRGRSSYAQQQTALVIVDGFESSLDMVSANEIETVTVLKDAAALALYGGRAANGVILIETKKGRTAGSSVEIRLQTGIQTPTQLSPVLDGVDYANLYNQALVNDGLAPKYSQDQLNEIKMGTNPYLYPNVNWQKAVLKNTAPLTRGDMTFRGGNDVLRYNEYYDNPPAEAFQAVNLVRARSGMPAFDNALTKDEFRQKLRNERAVELAYEDHRFWDIRRWMIAENEGVMQGKMYGLKLSPIVGQPNKAHYVPYVFERRSWSRRSYLHPIKQIEIDKGYLKQNPGW